MSLSQNPVVVDLLPGVVQNWAMAYGYGEATGGRYRYPSAEAEFTLYNFHAQQQVDELSEVLASKEQIDPRVIELRGDAGSGRNYLVRAAAHHAWQRGTKVDVETLSLDGYEPDAPLKSLLEFLSERAAGVAGKKLSELAKRTKIEIKVNPAHLLFASLGVKSELSVDELWHFFETSDYTPGPRMSERERLRLFLQQLTKERRLVLQLPNAHTADISLLLRLLDETDLNPNFFVSLSYPPGKPGPPKAQRNHWRIFVAAWTREEMERRFTERFRPNKIAAEFLDFAWGSGAVRHSRESFAQIMLRTVKGGWLAPDRKGIWQVDGGWKKNPQLVEEFSRDLLEPVLEIRAQLEESGVSDARIQNLTDFLEAAALCDPTVPVNPLLQMIGVTGEESDEFIDWLDELLRVDEDDGLMEDLGFTHPGFPTAQMLYRFRNPVLPETILRRHKNSRELALRMFDFLEGVFRPDTRTIAGLLLRVAEHAGIGRESERFGKLLSYWSSLTETESLAEAVGLELQAGSISPNLLWSVVEKSDGLWSPARRLALIEAYGQQPDGVPVGQRVSYLLVLASALYFTGHFQQATDAAQEAVSGDLPEPAWSAELRAHALLGVSELTLGHLVVATKWLESAVRLASANLPSDHPDMAASLNNLASLYESQGRYAEAEPLYQRALAIEEKAGGPDHPDVATSLNNLALLHHNRGRYAEAEPLHKRALAIREKALGPGHPHVATSLNNLALLYDSQGRYAEAEPLCHRALATEEKALGPDHPHVAASLNNLASLYNSQGRYAEAELLYQRALAIQEKALGPDHPDVATSLNNLALLYDKHRRYADAEPLFQRALAIREKVLGPDHLSVANSLNNLALVYDNQGRYAEAEPLYERASAIREKELGSGHPAG